MRLPLYQVDAFASRVFTGNPAAVCPLDAWLDDGTLQGIALENNLSETAFLVAVGDGWELRWFTPATEVKLCGHATLASAWVVFERLGRAGSEVSFDTRWSGVLRVEKRGDRLAMDLPSRPPRVGVAPQGLAASLGVDPREVYDSEEDLLVVLRDETAVRGLTPDLSALEALEARGVIVTAPGDACDFVSRYFAPRFGVPEDPVTGSAHCVLTPYWAERLGKPELAARQVSTRGGELGCEDRGERVTVAGRVVPYLEGTIEV